MSMILTAIFGALLAIAGIGVIDRPFATVGLITYFVISLAIISQWK